MAQAVRNQEVSAKELVSASLARVKETNPALNAVISLRAEEALTEADQLIDHGQPFLGVPLLLKGLGQTSTETACLRTRWPNRAVTLPGR